MCVLEHGMSLTRATHPNVEIYIIFSWWYFKCIQSFWCWYWINPSHFTRSINFCLLFSALFFETWLWPLISKCYELKLFLYSCINFVSFLSFFFFLDNLYTKLIFIPPNLFFPPSFLSSLLLVLFLFLFLEMSLCSQDYSWALYEHWMTWNSILLIYFSGSGITVVCHHSWLKYIYRCINICIQYICI